MSLLDEIKLIHGSRKDLRRFGIMMALAFAFVGGLLHWRGHGIFILFYILAGLFLLIGAFGPVVLRPIHKVWMSLALVLGWFTTRIILILMFYLVFTPVGLVGRMFGKDFLDEKIDRAAPSYWHIRKDTKSDPEQFETQF